MPKQRPYARTDKKALFVSSNSKDYAAMEEGQMMSYRDEEL